MKPENPIGASATERSGGSLQSVRRLLPGLLFAVLVGMTLALFWPAVSHPFMAIDDSEYVTDHPLVPLGLTWPGVGFAFTTRHSGNWHPLTTLAHMLDCQLFGLNPAGHHFVNILLHALNAGLVFWVWRTLTGSEWRSALLAAFFALHPLRVESVAWVSERKDVLSVFFALLTIWAYGRYAAASRAAAEGRSGIPTPKPAGDGGPDSVESQARAPADFAPRHSPGSAAGHPASVTAAYRFALGFFALGLMSKPMLVTLPFLLLLLDYWPLGRFGLADLGFRISNLRRLWPLVREKIPFFALCGLVCYITLQVQQHAMADPKVLPLPTRLANMFLSYRQYLAQTFWPSGLGVVYPYNLNPPPAEVALAVALVLGVTLLAWTWRERLPWFVIGWLWFVGTLIPVIGIVQVGIQAHADRYTYLPSIGLWTLLVWTVAHFTATRTLATPFNPAAAAPRVEQPALSPPRRFTRFGLRGVAAVLAGAALCGLAVLTRTQLSHWESTEKLMLHTERVAGASELVRGALGEFYLNEGRLAEAETQYRLGLQLDANSWPSVIGLAIVYARQGKPQEAERLYRRALASRPTPAYHFQLADLLHEQKRYEEARLHYLQGLARAPYHAGARARLGNLYYAQKNWSAAREQYERALRLNPKSPGLHYNLGLVLAIQGHRAEAIERFRRAIELDRTYAEAHNSLGYLLAAEGHQDAAIGHFRAALASKPDLAAAHQNLAEALARRGELDLARTHFEAALKFQTNFAKARIGLAGVCVAQHRPAEAMAHLRAAIQLEPENPEPLNNLAWLLATQPNPALRDGAEAVRLASRAVELSRTNDVDMLDTLAAAHAELGQFEQAVTVAARALELLLRTGQTNRIAELSNRLTLYRHQTPYRVSAAQ